MLLCLIFGWTLWNARHLHSVHFDDVSVITISLCTTKAYTYMAAMLSERMNPRILEPWSFSWVSPSLFITGVGSIWFSWRICGSNNVDDRQRICDWVLTTALFVLLSLIMSLLVRFLAIIGRWLLRLGRNLLVTLLQEDVNASPMVDDHGTASVAFFVMNLSLCALYFCYIYDPRGTVYPNWTGVFG